MAIKATVITNPKNRISINNQKRTEVRTIAIIPEQSSNKLVNLTDVDASNLANNNTLVYDSTSEKFVSKELPVLNGGTF